MKTFEKVLNRSIEWFTSILMATMVFVAIWQVVTRYILSSPSTFSEEFLRYSLIWIT
ncbi:TRAP transporter permease DctQ, partial [Bacillus sp. 7520-S]